MSASATTPLIDVRNQDKFGFLTIYILFCYKKNYRRGRLAQWKNARFVKFRPRGPRFETRRREVFSDRFAQFISDGRLNVSDKSINSRNLDLGMAVRGNQPLCERERSPKIGP